MNEEEQFLMCVVPCLFDYERETGKFRWKWKIGGSVKGGLAGKTHDHGYNILTFLGKNYYAHRIVWFLEKGYMPKNFIDHIDGNTSNNSILNLRECTASQNSANSKLRRSNKWGVKGLCYTPKGKKNWVARVESKGKVSQVLFSKKEEAIPWLEKTRIELHLEFCNHG